MSANNMDENQEKLNTCSKKSKQLYNEIERSVRESENLIKQIVEKKNKLAYARRRLIFVLVIVLIILAFIKLATGSV